MEQERILVIDDDEGLLHLLRMRLSSLGFTVTLCAAGSDALAAARRETYDLAITDLRLRGEDGLVLTEELLRVQPGLPVIILTAHGSIPNAVEAMQRGAFGYLTKPFDDRELKATIDKALIQHRMTREIQRLKSLVRELYGLENVVARSAAMQRLFQQIAQVADSDATVLLTGETGTGKEVLARVLHANSRRAKGPFVAVNCAAISETLFESELFGHVRGAFTSAVATKRGLFQSANGGTLFLDEIAEMPLPMQVKLLRAVQEREVREVGADYATKVDVRILAATNRDLNEAVKGGSFRHDLYYRISVVPLCIPPLRDRKDDIPLLAQHFLRHSAKLAGKDVRGFMPSAMHRLMVYPWPGNVRELECRREGGGDVHAGHGVAGSSACDRGVIRHDFEALDRSQRGLRAFLPAKCTSVDRREYFQGRAICRSVPRGFLQDVEEVWAASLYGEKPRREECSGTHGNRSAHR